MNCPNCGSDRTYRKDPRSLTVHCETCQHFWNARQSQKALLRATHYLRRGPMKGDHDISVWHCPSDPSRYSFALGYGSGAASFKEYADDPFLSGSFDTPEAALAAGIEEVKAIEKV